MTSIFPCPKCGRVLEPSGEVSLSGGATFPVFQCDDCVVEVTFLGETTLVALTFAIGPDGKPFDPASPTEPFPPSSLS